MSKGGAPTLVGIRITLAACQECSFLGPTSRDPDPMGVVGWNQEPASSVSPTAFLFAVLGLIQLLPSGLTL